MNRKEAIEKLNKIIDYYWIEIEDKGMDDEITEIMEVLEKPITLADLLGWKEGVEYKYDNGIYKLQNGNIYHQYGLVDNLKWEEANYHINFILKLQQAKKVEPKLKAYHVKDEYSYDCLMKELEEQGYVCVNGFPLSTIRGYEDEYPYVIEKENKKIMRAEKDDHNFYGYDLIEYHKEEPLYYAELKVPAGIETHSWLKQLNYDNTVFDMVSWFQLDKRDAKTKTEWSKLDINNTNVNFREVKE